MKQSHFIRSRENAWQQFEVAAQQQKTHFDAHFPSAYRQVCCDLSLARTRQYSPQLIERLNRLVNLGQQRLYQLGQSPWTELWQLIGRDALAACFRFRYWVWFSLALFYGLSLIGAAIVLYAPDNIGLFMEQKQIIELNQMYDPTARSEIERSRESDLLMFGFYIYNNISIAFQTFAGGFLFCLGALFYLVFNGLFLGAVSGHMINQGFTETFFSFVIGHGSTELTAIALSGAAGCRLGYALLVPGIYSRLVSLRLVAMQVLPIVAVAFVMLVLAAGIEAFWSPRDIAPVVKYSVGAAGWLAVSYWLYRGTCRGC